MAWFVLYFWSSIVAVAVMRLRRGPKRPTWSFGYEVVTRAQKRFHERVARLTPQEERRAWASLKGPTPSAARIERKETSLGSVDCVEFGVRGQAPSGRVILYLHGGSFMHGSEASHGELCSRIAIAARSRLVFPLYRLAPEHPFPAALEDSLAAYRGLVASGVSPSDIVVAGDSAGGNFSLALLTSLRDRSERLPGAAVLISPCVDLADRSASMTTNEPFDWASAWMFERWQREYLQGTDPTDPLAAPGRAELGGLPPLLIQVGTAELLHDQVSALAARAKAAGVVVTFEAEPDRAHLWHALAPMFPEFQASIDRIGAFVLSDRA